MINRLVTRVANGRAMRNFALLRAKYSGRSVGARVQLEVADERNDLATGNRGVLPGAESRVTAHRVTTFALMPLRRGP
ncbi:hypothetical protein [Mycobacterium sp. 4858]|uniref:hypothetical protein n=1 Tax=Mycobacterium sp. 4858 TaxID=2057185 RepID=UPI0018EB0F49|nr:hypothetical protein [Mycobacterium sp. 4858]